MDKAYKAPGSNYNEQRQVVIHRSGPSQIYELSEEQLLGLMDTGDESTFLAFSSAGLSLGISLLLFLCSGVSLTELGIGVCGAFCGVGFVTAFGSFGLCWKARRKRRWLMNSILGQRGEN